VEVDSRHRTTVGVIGLGAIGRPIAHRVIAAGFATLVHSRGHALVGEFTAVGADWCTTPAEVAASADVILLAVASEQDLTDVLGPPGGLVASLQPGVIVCDVGTHSPAAMVEADAMVRAAGAAFLDTAVSGGVLGASSGTLSLMAGGDEDALRRVRPVLEAFASTIVHFGPVGSGAIAKACNQLVVGSTIEAVAEALTLGRLSGLDPALLREAMLGGFAASTVLEIHGQRMLDRAFSPGGRVDLHAKDARIVIDQARRVGMRVPGFEPVAAALEAMVAAGDGALDHAALITLLEGDIRDS
jgi:3-hydroxyisobutyrate dehydrogenase-like beta-hydroxyacid dehydrogenase